MYLVPDPSRAGDPQEVVDAISQLIASPAGARPVRLTVRNPLPQIEEINRLSQEVHRSLFPHIGLGELLKVAVRHENTGDGDASRERFSAGRSHS